RRKSEQGPEIRANRKIQSLSQNIVVTDYLHFIWINKDGVQRETLCHPADLEDRKFRLREDRADAVRKLLQAFFSTAPEGIGRAQQARVGARHARQVAARQSGSGIGTAGARAQGGTALRTLSNIPRSGLP